MNNKLQLTQRAGEIVTAAIGNTHWRDNLLYLKGTGEPVVLGHSLILPDGAGYYIHIPSLTTTQRDALTPTAGMLIYNSTTTKFNKYENGAWREDLAYNGDLSTLQIASQAEGDIYYRGASAWARLGIGTATKLLAVNAGATAPEWVTAPIADTFPEVASSNLRNSNDTERYQTNTDWVKVKEVVVNAALAACTIKFDMKNDGSTYVAHGQICKNDVAIGTDQTRNANTYATYSQDFTALNAVATDKIQIYGKNEQAANSVYIQNMRFYYDKQITKIGGVTLTTPLASSDDPTISMTNQDPASA